MITQEYISDTQVVVLLMFVLLFSIQIERGRVVAGYAMTLAFCRQSIIQEFRSNRRSGLHKLEFLVTAHVQAEYHCCEQKKIYEECIK